MQMNLTIELELDPTAGGGPVRNLWIRNRGAAVAQATLQIRSTGKALVPLEIPLSPLESNTRTQIPQAQQLRYDLPYLRSLCHNLTTEMVLSIVCDGRELYSRAEQFSVDKACLLPEGTEFEEMIP